MSTEQSDARMVADMLGHLDPLHAACIQARDGIRRQFKTARTRAGTWTPQPAPPRLKPDPLRDPSHANTTTHYPLG